MATYTYPTFPYQAPHDLMSGAPQRKPLVIIGAGPVGLAAAIDARLQGLDVLLFDEDDSVSFGSRAVCYAKRALEILDRLGVGDAVVDKGVSWNVGRTFMKEEEKKPENIMPRVKAMLGDDRECTLEWASIYTFQCRRMTNFRHGHLLFAGDAAHQVSPFGARGANSGFQDTDDLLWKLALVIKGQAPEALLDTYNDDRVYAADENIRNSTRSTDFITPKSAVSKLFRNAALELARSQPFARKLVNSGRLSVPAFLVHSALNTPDVDSFAGDMVPGAPLDDAPVRLAGADAWLLDQLGNRFVLLAFADSADAIDTALPGLRAQAAALAAASLPVQTRLVTAHASAAPAGLTALHDRDGLLAQRLDARPGTCYLVRPDQHVAARWRRFDATALQAALYRATAQPVTETATA
jgi:3-(3-hydroxy-phenyl)propionate hydroxylase